MTKTKQLEWILRGGVTIMHSEAWKVEGFPDPISSERLLLSREGDNTLTSVLAHIIWFYSL